MSSISPVSSTHLPQPPQHASVTTKGDLPAADKPGTGSPAQQNGGRITSSTQGRGHKLDLTV